MPTLTPALEIDKSGEIRFMKHSQLQDSITRALEGIDAERGVRLDVQYDKDSVAGILVLKKNNRWSVAQAFAVEKGDWAAQTSVLLTW